MDRCYKAKTAVEEEDSAMTFRELHSKLVGGRSYREAMLMDSGCTRDIVAQAIVSDLGLNIQKLDRPINIVSANGNLLDITGTVSLNMTSKVTGEKRKRIEAVVLRGGTDRELLISLKI